MPVRPGSEDGSSARRERSAGRVAVNGGVQPKGQRRQKTLDRRLTVWKKLKKKHKKVQKKKSASDSKRIYLFILE